MIRVQTTSSAGPKHVIEHLGKAHIPPPTRSPRFRFLPCNTSRLFTAPNPSCSCRASEGFALPSVSQPTKSSPKGRCRLGKCLATRNRSTQATYIRDDGTHVAVAALHSMLADDVCIVAATCNTVRPQPSQKPVSRYTHAHIIKQKNYVRNWAHLERTHPHRNSSKNGQRLQRY